MLRQVHVMSLMLSILTDKDAKSKVGDQVKISKHNNICAKCYIPNWSEEVFVINKVKTTVLMLSKVKKLFECWKRNKRNKSKRV